MTPIATFTDWSPETYSRFRGLRLRPAMDLMQQVPQLPEGPVVDLGCGNGAVGAALKHRFKAPMIGVDLSPAMLEAAGQEAVYDTLQRGDIGEWQSSGPPPALIFSNAACHWVPDHGGLFPRLAGMLAPGGSLAVQMPRQYNAPSHALLRSISEKMFPERFDFAGWTAPVMAPTDYLALLSPLGEVDVWETQFLQRLQPGSDGHPVRRFTQATAMRPFLEELSEEEQFRFTAAYDAALASAYPTDDQGGAVMPFRRVFFVVTI